MQKKAFFWEWFLEKKSKYEKTVIDTCVSPFYLLFGCPMDNFGALLRGETYSSNINHCVFINFLFKCHRVPRSKSFLEPVHASPYIELSPPTKFWRALSLWGHAASYVMWICVSCIKFALSVAAAYLSFFLHYPNFLAKKTFFSGKLLILIVIF